MAQFSQRKLDSAHHKLFQMRTVLLCLPEQSLDQHFHFCMTVFTVCTDVLSFVSSLRSFTICKVSSILQWRKDTFTGYFITLYYLASQPSKTEARQKTEAVPHLNHWKASFQHQQAAGYSNDFNEICHQLSFIQSCVDVILSFCFLPQEILWSLAQVYFYSCMQCIPFLFK